MRRVLSRRAHILTSGVYRMSSVIGSSKQVGLGEATATMCTVLNDIEHGTTGNTNKIGSTCSKSARSMQKEDIKYHEINAVVGTEAGASSPQRVHARLNTPAYLSEVEQLRGLGFGSAQDEEPEDCSCIKDSSCLVRRVESADQRDQQEAAVRAALRDAPLGPELFDAHCHLQLHPLKPYANLAVALANVHGVKCMGVCGTAPGADWEAVRALHEAHGQAVVPSFGLHPWWIAGYLQQASLKQYDEQWTVELEMLLRRYPAAHVGECGLDKAVLKDGVSYALQEEVMRRHMQLAGKYGRALTVHCVAGCWDRLLALLKAEQLGVDRYVKEAARKGSQDALEGTSSMPPAIILHSCNTLPKDLMYRFMDVRNVYFSISGGGRAGQSAKTIALASAVPSDRLLLETDSPDQLPATLRRCGLQHNEPALLRYHCGILAAELGEPPAQLAKRTSDNAVRAYQLSAATP